MIGKQYLADLTSLGYPVIPTVDRRGELDRLPEVAEYVLKLKPGADSTGIRFVGREPLEDVALSGMLVQPRVKINYEVSFYYIGRTFHYALYALTPDQRWTLNGTIRHLQTSSSPGNSSTGTRSSMRSSVSTRAVPKTATCC
jgi:hypothetical protein